MSFKPNWRRGLRTVTYAGITYGLALFLHYRYFDPSTVLLLFFWAGMAYMSLVHHDDKVIHTWVGLKGRMWLRWWKWNQLPCPYCDGTDFGSRKEVIEWGWGTMEFEEYCIHCKQTTNYWAYGYFEYPKTRTEEWSRRWYNVKNRILSWGWFRPNLKKIKLSAKEVIN